MTWLMLSSDTPNRAAPTNDDAGEEEIERTRFVRIWWSLSITNASLTQCKLQWTFQKACF